MAMKLKRRGVNERYFLVGRPWTWLSIVLVGVGVWLVRHWVTVARVSRSPSDSAASTPDGS